MNGVVQMVGGWPEKWRHNGVGALGPTPFLMIMWAWGWTCGIPSPSSHASTIQLNLVLNVFWS